MRVSPSSRELIPDEAATTSWRDAMAALRCYAERCGTGDVPPPVRARGVNLGKWVARCRDDYWFGVLSVEHTRELEAIAGWQWGPDRPNSWRHASMPSPGTPPELGTTELTEATTFDGVDLQAWTATQRQAYAAFRLPAASIELLEELPGWQWDADTADGPRGLPPPAST